MSEVTKPIALDESFNTTGQTPKNIADVIKNGLQEVAQAIDSHQGGGGHVILDQNGNALDQEPNMQFVDAHTSDDSVNTKTVIENIKSATEADFRTATEDGLYDVDVEGAEIGEISEEYVEVTADGIKTWATLLNELYALIDATKISQNSLLVVDFIAYKIVCVLTYTTSAEYQFSKATISSGNKLVTDKFVIKSANSTYGQKEENVAISDRTSQQATSGTKITLYYGNDKAVVDLQTTANRCLMSNGESVESALNTQDLSITPINGTIQAGGVKRIGDLIVINIRYVSTSASAVGDSIITLPYNITSSTAHVQLTNNKNYGIDLLSNKIRTNSAIASGETIIISGAVVVEV